MEYYELTFTVSPIKDIPFEDCSIKIGEIINKSMLQDGALKKFHKDTGYKFYVYSNFYPIEKDKIYRQGRIYVLKFRTLDLEFAQKIKQFLSKTKNDLFSILAVQLETFEKKYISNLYSVTPVVVTLQSSRNWVKEDDIFILQQKLQANLEKKYNDFFNEKLQPTQNFIQRIEIKNIKPMVTKYKNTKIFGNKFKIYVNEDEVSQKLAFIAMATGLGEKGSSMGLGFCMGGEL